MRIGLAQQDRVTLAHGCTMHWLVALRALGNEGQKPIQPRPRHCGDCQVISGPSSEVCFRDDVYDINLADSHRRTIRSVGGGKTKNELRCAQFSTCPLNAKEFDLVIRVPQTSGVDEDDLMTLDIERHFDDVTRRPGDRSDDSDVAPCQSV